MERVVRIVVVAIAMQDDTKSHTFVLDGRLWNSLGARARWLLRRGLLRLIEVLLLLLLYASSSSLLCDNLRDKRLRSRAT